MTISIESGDTDDVDAVTDLWVDLATGQREHGSHISPEVNRTYIRETIVRHAVGGTLVLARNSASTITGFVMFSIEDPGYEQDVTRGYVENLYVRPESRDEGVGSSLLSAAHETLRERGVDVLALEVMADNEDARRFYRQHGYEPHRIELERSVENDTHSKGGE